MGRYWLYTSTELAKLWKLWMMMMMMEAGGSPAAGPDGVEPPPPAADAGARPPPAADASARHARTPPAAYIGGAAPASPPATADATVVVSGLLHRSLQRPRLRRRLSCVCPCARPHTGMCGRRPAAAHEWLARDDVCADGIAVRGTGHCGMGRRAHCCARYRTCDCMCRWKMRVRRRL